MSVEFEEENNITYKSRAILGASQTPNMVRWMVNKGLVKNEMWAGKMLILSAVAFFTISIFILWQNFYGSPSVPSTPIPSLAGYKYIEDVPVNIRGDLRVHPELEKLPSRTQ